MRTAKAPPRDAEEYVEYDSRYRELTAAYQAGLMCPDDPAAAAAGEVALAELMVELRPLVASRVLRIGRERASVHLTEDVIADAVTEGLLVAIDHAARYDPDRCPAFTNWLLTDKGDLNKAIRHHFENVRWSDGFKATERRILRVAHGRLRDFRRDHGREPSRDELDAEIAKAQKAWAEGLLTPEQKELPDEERDRLVKQKLTQSGSAAAARDVHRLLVLEQANFYPAHLDDTGWDWVEEAGADEWLDAASHTIERDAETETARTLVQMAIGDLNEAEGRIVAEHLAGIKDEETFPQVAKRLNLPVSAARAVMSRAQSRLGAPHAQFAYLAGRVEAQFEVASTGGGAALALAGAAARR